MLEIQPAWTRSVYGALPSAGNSCSAIVITVWLIELDKFGSEHVGVAENEEGRDCEALHWKGARSFQPVGLTISPLV